MKEPLRRREACWCTWVGIRLTIGNGTRLGENLKSRRVGKRALFDFPYVNLATLRFLFTPHEGNQHRKIFGDNDINATA